MLSNIIAFTASRTQVVTYLLCIALFSISFLVFLNSSISFVITERIGDRDNVGDAVGTLGFADELVALVACPLWGIVSDRIGVRTVAALGYAIVGCSLFVICLAKHVYPDLLLARLFFSVGGAATATMVTAILPAMTFNADADDAPVSDPQNNRRHTITPSISSELTITPARWRSQSPTTPEAPVKARKDNSGASTSRLAGVVGMFTGLGALIALFAFLPLPTRFENAGHSRGTAVADSFYVVGAVAFVVAIGCFFGLRNLPGEDNKKLRHIWHRPSAKSQESSHRERLSQPVLTYAQQLVVSLKLAFYDHSIGLGYLGGFVARASSVAISLFIPLFCNAYFISSGKCPSPNTPHGALPPDFKESCHRAYILASILSGTSQLIALLCAPVFGYLASRTTSRFNPPLLASSITGIAGYVAFALVQSPDPKTEDGSAGIFFVVALLGISQIGAIVCSLSLLGRGIQNQSDGDAEQRNESVRVNISPMPGSIASSRPDTADGLGSEEAAPLLQTRGQVQHAWKAPEVSGSRTHVKGSIAGLYSLLGGAGILLLTKVGGALFDSAGKGAPFWMMAVFNALLALGCIGTGVRGWFEKRR